jgi:hypothetical protein
MFKRFVQGREIVCVFERFHCLDLSWNTVRYYAFALTGQTFGFVIFNICPDLAVKQNRNIPSNSRSWTGSENSVNRIIRALTLAVPLQRLTRGKNERSDFPEN